MRFILKGRLPQHFVHESILRPLCSIPPSEKPALTPESKFVRALASHQKWQSVTISFFGENLRNARQPFRSRFDHVLHQMKPVYRRSTAGRGCDVDIIQRVFPMRRMAEIVTIESIPPVRRNIFSKESTGL